MSLTLLVSKDLWQEFDEAWKERMISEEPIDELVAALKLAGEKKRISRYVSMAREQARQFEELDRAPDAALILGTVLTSGGNPTELSADLWRCAEAAWSKEPWWEPYSTLAGLAEGIADLRGPWRAFSKLCAFREGTLIFHPGGWGAGEVLSVDSAALEMVVRFMNGRKDTFPMNAAIDIFEPLPETDLRALYFRDAEGLRKRAKKEPLEILRMILTRHHGRVTTAAVRNALMGIDVEGSAWSAWYRKARKLAENSEWFEVTGSPQKSVFTLLLTAKDPTSALRKTLERASSLAEAHARVRDLFVGAHPDEEVVSVGLEALDNLAASEEEPLEERLAAWLFLRELRKESPEAMLTVLREVRDAPPPHDPSIPPEVWKLFQALPNVKDQERAVDILPELFGEQWLDPVIVNLQHAAPGQVRLLVDASKAAGRDDDLRQLYSGLLARPLRAPSLLVTLASMYEDGEVASNMPTPVQRAQALVSLANHLHQTRRGNPQLTRVCTRLTELLTGGSTPLLRKILGQADLTALHAISVMLSRGVDEAIDHLVTDVALEKDRDFFAGDSDFWQGQTIWTTRAGLERRAADLRELKEVKIPANQDAIGRAAAFGDLSENSEWEAAIEEQRNLTTRAMEIETELRQADLLENALIPEDTVAPGTKVRYREMDSGEERVVLILGPWDGDERDGVQVVSYRAPLAGGLLGRHGGDRVAVKVPEGELDIEVLSVEPAAGN